MLVNTKPLLNTHTEGVFNPKVHIPEQYGVELEIKKYENHLN